MLHQAHLFEEPRGEVMPDLADQARVLVAFSGGKDSLACVLHLLELGVARDRIELHHHLIDGRDPDQAGLLMDWPCTERYVRLVAEALGIQVRFSWREGGFAGELFRQDAVPAPVSFETAAGVTTLPSTRATPNTRRRFPAATADLNRRWCSPALKIDVMSRWLANDLTMQGTKASPRRLLVVTGERREESPARSRYAPLETHRSNARHRRILHWRPVLDWDEREVWAIIRRWALRPHPAYLLGFARCSCEFCVFNGPDQWAMHRALTPERFRHLERAERDLSFTIDRSLPLAEKADKGSLALLPQGAELERARRWALDPEALTLEDVRWTWPDGWYPRGAFKGSAGGSV